MARSLASPASSKNRPLAIAAAEILSRARDDFALTGREAYLHHQSTAVA